jgi:hypothetical protein
MQESIDLLFSKLEAQDAAQQQMGVHMWLGATDGHYRVPLIPMPTPLRNVLVLIIRYQRQTSSTELLLL